MSDPGAGSPGPGGRRGPRAAWSWILLALALVVSAIVRVPLVRNARTHLDSDLAVDGLTLVETTQGRWRWHFPGTPHIGTAPLAAMVPAAWVVGPTPLALGITGLILNGSTVVATYVLARRTCGPRVAAWSLLPMAFASTGTIWLSGRITGGHLLAVSWHAVAFTLLYVYLARGGPIRALAMGLWCGLGLWVDSMFLMTLAGLIPAGIAAWFRSGRARRGLISGLIFALGMAVGGLPAVAGRSVDPYDAYGDQFAPIWRADVLLGHAKILALDCLPRLIAGHRLPGLEADPGRIGPDGQALPGTSRPGAVSLAVVSAGLGLFLIAVPGLAFDRRPVADLPGRAVRWGLLISTTAVLAGFVLNRNIFNSDNYRYLVLLLVPWSLGLGRLLDRLSRKGQGGAAASALVGAAFAASFTLDAADWYRGLGWVDERRLPVERPLSDPMLEWLGAHPEAVSLYGGYWDVYRLSFLTRGRVRGIPSGHFPDRFPEWSHRLAGGHPTHALARSTPVGLAIRRRVLQDRGTIQLEAEGGTLLAWP